MEERDNSIRAIIERRIAASGKTKREVTELAGINSGNLNKMIDSPSWPTLERIARALDISVAELISEANPQPDGDAVITCPECGRKILLKAE